VPHPARSQYDLKGAATTDPVEVGRALVTIDGFDDTPVVKAVLLLLPPASRVNTRHGTDGYQRGRGAVEDSLQQDADRICLK